ncbi:TetR/AcrR family transcriptional regulator [Nocardioides salsibiostraticola]
MTQADIDGRSSRWDRHREERYAALVAASVRAIDQHGPDVAIATIAAEAGVSKPVLYRYFADKDELHAAVGRWGAAEVVDGMVPAFLIDTTVRERIRGAVGAYLGVIEEHPQVFNLLVRQRGGHDPLADGKARIVEAINQILSGSLHRLEVDADGIEAWSQGMVGLALTTGEWWLETGTLSRTEVRDQLADFIWHAFGGLVRERGADLSVLDA